MSEENLIDLEQWSKQRENVRDLAKSVANGNGSTDSLIVQTAKLQEMTAGVVDALLNDMSFLHNLLKMSQMQMSNIAQQSFLTLEIVKRKGITTSEEVHELYQEILQHQAEQQAAAEKAAQQAVENALHDENNPERIAEFKSLIEQGFSEQEARATVWPEQLLETAQDEQNKNTRAEIIPFSGASKKE